METLKLIGAGHKVSLIRDDAAKLVDLGSIFLLHLKKNTCFLLEI